jgi:hypothetical protein
MKIGSEIVGYLKGTEFSNSLEVNLEKTKYLPVSRENAITEMIKDSDVIHLGCSDHIPIIAEKIKNNKWLHKLITDNSRSCIGIDIDKESIEYISKDLGYSNVRHGDIMTDSFHEITEKKWDFIVLGEIVEHLDNPVDFLKMIKSKYGTNIKKFIITVPSIYNENQIRNMFHYREVINSDHRFWFTPYTITKLLFSAGLNPDKITFANLQSLNFAMLAIRKIKRMLGLPEKYPFYYFNTIIITGTIN